METGTDHEPVATFAARWRQAVAGRPEQVFLRFEGGDGVVTEWTYAEFDAVVDAVAGGFRDRGVGPGDSVLLALTNSPAFVAAWLAVVRLGAWMVPVDPRATTAEIAALAARTDPRVVVVSEERSVEVTTRLSLPRVPVVAVDPSTADLAPLLGDPLPSSERPEPAARDRAAVLFTSGSTAAPKGVVITQANYAFAGDVMAAASTLRADDRLLVVLPLFHANAQYYSVAAAISAGATVVLISTFSASRLLLQAAAHEVTHASLFAAPMRMVLARADRSGPALALRHCWFAQNLTPDQYDEISGLLGCRPRQLYGMTETIPAVLTNRALSPVPDVLGEPTLGCRVDLRDPVAGTSVADGEVGEIVVHGEPGITLFDGYMDDPATTSASFRDGWFRTGDLGVRGASGIAFTGRRSDVLKVAGENVSVVEVEEVVALHPSVFDVAVVGEPDPVRDEVPVAYVVAADGADIDPADLDRHCAERLAPAKRPRRFEVVDELPRTSVGKVRRFLLKPDNADPREPSEGEVAAASGPGVPGRSGGPGGGQSGGDVA